MDSSGQHASRDGRQLVLVWTRGLADQFHAHRPQLTHVQASLASVALETTRDGIFPVQAPSSTSRHDVIERQVPRVKEIHTILTAIFVSQKDIAPGKGRSLFEFGNVLIEGNDAGKGNFQIGRSNHDIGIDIDDRHLAIEDGLDGLLPIPHTQWQIRHGLIVGIQDERRSSVQTLGGRGGWVAELIEIFVGHVMAYIVFGKRDVVSGALPFGLPCGSLFATILVLGSARRQRGCFIIGRRHSGGLFRWVFHGGHLQYCGRTQR